MNADQPSNHPVGNPEPAAKPGISHEEYQAAHQHGRESAALHAGREFDDAEAEMELEWHRKRGTSGLSWDEVKPAAKDGWNRVTEMGEGD